MRTFALCRKSSPQLTLETAIGSTQQLYDIDVTKLSNLVLCSYYSVLIKLQY